MVNSIVVKFRLLVVNPQILFIHLQKFATGDLLLSLCYVPHGQVLQGIVQKASNLPRHHKWGLAGTCCINFAYSKLVS